MISKDQSIVTQVAAKIAAELIVKTEDTMKNVSEWLTAFDAVNEALMNAHATELIRDAFPGTTEVATKRATVTPNYSAPQPKSGTTDISVAGKQHGDLPNWLITACAKSGVSRVWDNRDTAVGTKRPWFKQADAPEGVEPAAFWPPKGTA